MEKRTKASQQETYHHGDLRQALLSASIEILKREGPHALSLREAARVAGVSHAAPYRHFKDKEALLAAVAQEGFQALNDKFAAVEKAETDSLRTFKSMIRVYMNFALERPEQFRLMFGGFIRNSQNFDELNAEARKAFTYLMASIERCQKAGVMKAGDSRKQAVAAWSMVHGQAMLFIDGALSHMTDIAKNPVRAAEQLTEFLLEGIRG